jgi:hypothetical protein
MLMSIHYVPGAHLAPIEAQEIGAKFKGILASASLLNRPL